jgi:hypothetical protein
MKLTYNCGCKSVQNDCGSETQDELFMDQKIWYKNHWSISRSTFLSCKKSWETSPILSSAVISAKVLGINNYILYSYWSWNL